MKKSDLKKISTSKRTSYARLITSFKRIFTNEHKSTSQNLQVPMKRLSDTFLTSDELWKINSQLIGMERQKAEAIGFIRTQNRCV